MAKQKTEFEVAPVVLAFLTDQLFLKERVDNNIDVHPSTSVIEQFEKLALQISTDPKKDFSWRGCQDCVNYLVKFVYDNIERLGVAIVENKIVETKKANGLKNDE